MSLAVDLSIGLSIAFGFILLWAYYTRSLLFTLALACKFVGSVGIGLLYMYHYGSGDTIDYYRTTQCLYQIFKHNFFDWRQLYFEAPANNIPIILKYTDDAVIYNFLIDNKVMALIRLTFPLYILSGGSYFGIGILLSTLGFVGNFLFYKIVEEKINRLKERKMLAWAFFFVPSVVFWTSGLLKETLALALVTAIIVVFDRLFITNKLKNWRGVASAAASAGLILWLYALKPYMLLALVPFLWFWYIGEKKWLSKPTGRWLLLGGLIIFLIALNFTTYNFQYIIGQMRGLRYEISIRPNFEGNTNASTFYINLAEPSVWEYIYKSPLAAFTTLYRPFWGDGLNRFYFVSIVENTLLLLGTIYLIVFKIRFKQILSQPIVWFLGGFSIMYAIFLGFTIPNFGSLLRYRAIIVELWVVCLVLSSFSSNFPPSSSAGVGSNRHNLNQ